MLSAPDRAGPRSRSPARLADRAWPLLAHPAASVPNASNPQNRVLRHHWLATALLVAGLILRALSQIAYRPALLYIDSAKYMYGASPGADPVGYKIPLKLILFFGNLTTVVTVQHFLGLAMATALYALLLRRGSPRWFAALAVAPLLLDAYQVQMEQTIMPDVWFEALIVAGLILLLWLPKPVPWMVIAAGLMLGTFSRGPPGRRDNAAARIHLRAARGR
jgi:hypothetical protein